MKASNRKPLEIGYEIETIPYTDFFQDIANAAFATYKVKPDFVQALSGR